MSKLFLDIFNLSITASWLIVAVLAVRFLFRKRVPKWVNCVMWGIVGLRLLIPFTLESPFSLSVNREVINTDAVYGEAPTDTVPPTDDVVVPPADNAGGETQEQPNVDNNTQTPDNTPELSPENTQDKVYIQSGIDVLDDRLNPVINGTVSSVTPSEEPPLRKLVSIASYIWLAGTVILLTYAVINYLLLKYRVSSAIPFANSVRKSERVDTPFVLGFFRPRIYLPFGLSPETEESVVAHENAHIRRNDHIVKPLGYAILAVYWFNPLVWVAYILLCRDIECACDEKVIKNLSAEARKAYATALLECSIRKNYIAACPLAFGEIGVKDRVKNTMRYRRPTFWIIFTAILVCLVVSVLFLTSPSLKANGETSEDISETESPLIENPATDFEYEISESKTGIIVNKYIGTSDNVVIPAEIEGLPVRSIRGVFSEDGSLESGVFEGSNIKSIVFPTTVFSIGYNTCKDCTALTSVTFAENSELTQIALSAFEGCTALKEIALPNTVTEIQSRAFYGCSALTEVDLPDELLKIGGSAFTECAALKKITIPAKLDLYFMNMGDSPLTLVPALEQIVFEEGREAIRGYALVNGSLDIKITVPKSVKEFSPYPFFVGREAKTEIVFIGDAPEIVEEGNVNFGVSTIYYNPETSGWDTFAWKGIYEMKQNNSSETNYTPAESFDYYLKEDGSCVITSYKGNDPIVKVPETINGATVTEIGSMALSSGKIKIVYLPDTVVKLKSYSLSNKNLEKVVLSKGLTSIGEGAFSGCSALKEITLPDTLVSIDNSAFVDCRSLKTLEIPSSVKYMGMEAFAGSGLETVILNEGLEHIGSNAFILCPITEITVPSSVKIIYAGAFSHCDSLIKVVLNEGLESIGYQTFEGTEITEISIPSTVVTMDERAFQGCNSVKKVYFAGNAPQNYSTEETKRYMENEDYTVYYLEGAEGFTSPEWYGYKTEITKENND